MIMMAREWMKWEAVEEQFLVALNKRKSPDRDKSLPKVLREFANVNIAHFCNLHNYRKQRC